MDSIQHGEHASDSGADGESQNHAEIVSGLTELFFFLSRRYIDSAAVPLRRFPMHMVLAYE